VPFSRLYFFLSGFYFIYFAILGVILPYWNLYLQSLGYSPVRIGELTAIATSSRIVAPNLWGWLADRRGHRMWIARSTCLLATLSFAFVIWAGRSFLLLALGMLLFSIFWHAALPQIEVKTLNHLGADTHRYSRIRIWGSVGFIVSALLAGVLVQSAGITTVPAVLLGLFFLLFLDSLAVPDKPQKVVSTQHPAFRKVLLHPSVIALLLVCFLSQVSHGPYYVFFSIYLESAGYSRVMIGLLWTTGVLAEIGIFLLMHRLLPHFGPRRLMLVTMALTSLRWLLIGGFVTHPVVLLLAQTLHAFSFGVYHAVAIHLTHRFFTGPHQGRGQALYSSVGFGAGGMLGSLAAGYLWVSVGPEVTYLLAAGTGALGWLVAWRGLRLPPQSTGL
jgi:PPP family 3-phenylpropionic acid transporter